MQLGFTMVELMVALALSLLVVAASVSALLVSRQGFTAADSTSQLRDNARFAIDFITRLSVQSGYKDLAYVDTSNQTKFKSISVTIDPDPYIFGLENAKVGSATDPIGGSVSNSRSTCPTAQGTACKNNSDILVLRYQTGSLNTDSAAGGNEVDNTMFNCAGVPEKFTPTASNDVVESVLYVDYDPNRNNGEPTLMCMYRGNASTGWNPATPLVQGVETFKVLYGTDGVVPNTVPVAGAALGTKPVAGQPDSIPERYLTAEQLTVAGNTVATNENWRRVRSLRIGLIVRGAVGSLQQPAARVFYPFAPQTKAGEVPTFASGALNIDASDTRLRQVVTFTVYLHNYQGI